MPTVIKHSPVPYTRQMLRFRWRRRWCHWRWRSHIYSKQRARGKNIVIHPKRKKKNTLCRTHNSVPQIPSQNYTQSNFTRLGNNNELTSVQKGRIREERMRCLLRPASIEAFLSGHHAIGTRTSINFYHHGLPIQCTRSDRL